MALDVVEALDNTGTEMVRRVPEGGSGEFKLGSQCIVRESQVAVFFRDGKAYDTFEPGRHTLSTMNLPLIGKTITDRVFGESPFKAEVYFVNQKVFLNLRWGTRDPIAYRDTELATVRLRARGNMAVRVHEPMVFVNKVCGTQGLYRTDDVHGHLKTVVVSALAGVLGEQLKSIFDLPLQYGDIAVASKAKVYEQFAELGIELVDFLVESVTPPDDVQKRIDERAGMAAVGDLDKYMQYKGAVALGDAAAQPGGAAGAAVGAGAGLGLGMAMPGMIQQSMQQQAQQQQQAPPAAPAQGGGAPAGAPAPGAPAPPPANTITCVQCQGEMPRGSKFCPNCGTGVVANACSSCGQEIATGMRFCPQCGTPAPGAPPPPEAGPPPGGAA